MNANINASGEAVILGVTSDTGVVAWQRSGNNTDGDVHDDDVNNDCDYGVRPVKTVKL